MPAPESSTRISASDSRSPTAIPTLPPAGVNFTALERRFQVTCCRRSASPMTKVGSMRSATSRIFLLAAAGRAVSSAARATSARSIRRTVSRSLPLTIRETSRTSSTSGGL